MVWHMGFHATFNNIPVISWRSVLLVEETGVPGENHWPVVKSLNVYYITTYITDKMIAPLVSSNSHKNWSLPEHIGKECKPIVHLVPRVARTSPWVCSVPFQANILQKSTKLQILPIFKYMPA